MVPLKSVSRDSTSSRRAISEGDWKLHKFNLLSSSSWKFHYGGGGLPRVPALTRRMFSRLQGVLTALTSPCTSTDRRHDENRATGPSPRKSQGSPTDPQRAGRSEAGPTTWSASQLNVCGRPPYSFFPSEEDSGKITFHIVVITICFTYGGVSSSWY